MAASATGVPQPRPRCTRLVLSSLALTAMSASLGPSHPSCHRWQFAEGRKNLWGKEVATTMWKFGERNRRSKFHAGLCFYGSD